MSDHQGAPRVSVFIAAFNAQETLREAVDSVLAQMWRDFELLIVDDGSTDATPDICQRYATDSRVRIERLPTNLGRAGARNAGLELARGEYFAVLDADDRCLPKRLETQVAFLDTYTHIDVLGTWSHLIDARGRRLPPKRNEYRVTPDEVSCHLLFQCLVDNPTVMARTAAIRAYRFDPEFPVAQDYDVWERMRMQHGMALLAERLTEYRIHDQQASIARIEEGWERRQAIQARQLSALGMEFDDRDLVKHHLLYSGRRMFERQTGRAMDADYAVWAEQWLRRLLQANERSQRYPKQAFASVVAAIWGNVMRKGMRSPGKAQYLSVFSRSKLSRIMLMDRARKKFTKS